MAWSSNLTLHMAKHSKSLKVYILKFSPDLPLKIFPYLILSTKIVIIPLMVS